MHGLSDIAELPRDEAIAALIRRTRRYAAYQRKWMRRIPCLVTVPADRPAGEVADEILRVTPGLGNDYLLVQRAEVGTPLTEEQVRRLCDYHFGVGSDGVLEVVSADGDEAEVVIWNPDGSTAELSGQRNASPPVGSAQRNRHREDSWPGAVVGRMRGTLDVEMDMGAVDVQEPETLDVGDETLEVRRVGRKPACGRPP